MLLAPRSLITPERLYMAALSLTGSAALFSIVLPPQERGVLVASIASATLGSAIGGFSIDTFLLSRPAGWVVSRGRLRILAMLLVCVAVSGAVAATVIAVAGIGSRVVGVGAACALTVFNAFSSLAMRVKRFVFAYSMKAAGGVALISGYAWLYVRGELTGGSWGIVWLGVQALIAIAAGSVVVRWAPSALKLRGSTEVRPVPAATVRNDAFNMVKLHLGICAQIVTYRLDQVLLARFAGAGPLGVYALAVAALEFAQAGAVVRAQKILADRGLSASATPRTRVVVVAALPVAMLSVVALWALGVLRPQYHVAWLYGLCLLPGCLAVSVGQVWSAFLLRLRGEAATLMVAVLTLAVAVPAYYLLIPRSGALGAAVASTCAYAVYALASRLSLRRLPEPVAYQVV